MESFLKKSKNLSFSDKLLCTLLITGGGFDDEKYLSEAHFNQEEILFSGTLELPSKLREIVKADKTHGAMSFDLFDQTILAIKVCEESDVLLQIKGATTFLEKHKTDLQKLRSYPEAQRITINFNSKQNENLSHFRDFLSPYFYKLLSECGIRDLMMG